MVNSALSPDNQARLPHFTALDGLRGIAAISIVLLHYFVNTLQATPGSPVAYLAKLVSPLWIGVDLFFVLSGFLVGRIVFLNSNSFNFLKVFYLRRATRIFPLYFLVVVFWVLAHQIVDASSSQMYYQALGDLSTLPYVLTFTQNLVLPFNDNSWQILGRSMAPTWSICVEEHFYWLAPLALPWLPKRRRVESLAAIWFGLLMLRFALVQNGISEYWLHYMLTPLHADGIMAGLIIAAINCKEAALPQSSSILKSGAERISAYFMPTWAGAFILIWLWLAVQGNPALSRAFDFLFIALLFLSLVWGLINNKAPKTSKILSYAPLRWLGERSFGIYLLHNGIAQLVFIGLAGKSPQWQSATDFLLLIVAFVITLLLANISFTWMEKPLLQSVRSIEYSKPRSRAAG